MHNNMIPCRLRLTGYSVILFNGDFEDLIKLTNFDQFQYFITIPPKV